MIRFYLKSQINNLNLSLLSQFSRKKSAKYQASMDEELNNFK